MLDINFKVPMPTKKALEKKRPNGSTYIYYNISSFRNKQGKPASVQIAIGKKDEETGQLIPNTRYFDIFPEHKPLGYASKSRSEQTKLKRKPKPSSRSNACEPVCVKMCGVSATLLSIATKIGMLDILKECFPYNWDSLLGAAFYIVSEGNVMMYIKDWFEENKAYSIKTMSDVDCSRLFESLSYAEKRKFFFEWIKYHQEREHIVYDVTSISTYSKNIEIAELGYNRDKEKLPQVNYGMFYGMSSMLPMYYNMYSGSIPDKTCLDFMLANAKDLGVKNACLVFDRGFMTNDNISLTLDSQYSFITALPGFRLERDALVDKVHGSIEKVENWIRDYKVYGVSSPVSIENKQVYAHIYYDLERKATETKEHYSYIDKLQDELESINKNKAIPKRYKEYFSITEQSKTSLTFKLDFDKVDEKQKRSGYFILLTNVKGLSSIEVLKIYREKDTIEKHFDMFKNDLEFGRLKTHGDKTTEGKMFVGFLALILRSHMHQIIRNNDDTKKMTFEKIMIELRKIKIVSMSDMTEKLLTLTKTQKTILEVMRVDIKSLTEK